MVDDSGGKPAAPEDHRSATSADEARAFTERAPRSKVAMVVVCTPSGGGPTVEAEVVNLSRSGMFIASMKLLAIGTTVEFRFKLDDAVVALRGLAEVVRRELRGMGLRFVTLDERGQELLSRLVEATSAVPESTPSAVEYGHGAVRVRLSGETAGYFTYNPLLHIGVGGCFLPTGIAVPLGTGYELSVVDAADKLLLRCRAKVAATQEGRIGLRFVGVERDTLQGLRSEIARMTGKTGKTTKAPPGP